MFVHVDLSWMSHPFPLNSFKITSPDQITTIRSLGLNSLRWSPERSELEPQDDSNPVGEPARDALAAQAPAARQAHREAVAAERAASLLAERRYTEASRALRETTLLVVNEPERARDKAKQLARTLIDGMLGDGELSIRAIVGTAGDRASAHGMNVAIVAMLMGRRLGLAEGELADLGVGAMLHDIGKIDLPERVRWCDDSFDAAAVAHYRSHLAAGVAHGRRMGLTPGALLVIAQHHEQADGNGFPLGLNIDRMSASARIVALVNRLDNLCNPPLPSNALTAHEALSLMFAQGQQQFDTTMLSVLIKMVGVYPPGSIVQLTDDRYAQVVTVNASRPLKPRIMVFDAAVPPDEALLIDLEHCHGVGIRRSLKPTALPREAYDYLSPRPCVAYFFEPMRDFAPTGAGAA